jgi:hypothetical protein
MPDEATSILLCPLSVSPVIVIPPAPPVVSALAKSAAFVSLTVVTVPALAAPTLPSNKPATQSRAAFPMSFPLSVIGFPQGSA